MRARALVFGINVYPASTGQAKLYGAVADAVDFAKWALDPHGGGVASDDLYFWTHPAPDPVPPELTAHCQADRPWPRAVSPNFSDAPTAKDITLAARDAAEDAADSRENDEEDERLYLFFAGHGVVTKKAGQPPQSCFLAADFEPNSAFGLVPLDDLRLTVAERGPKEAILICDCCRNALPITIPTPGLNIAQYEDREINEQWMHGSAAQVKAAAYEVPLETPERGAFTKMMLQALRQYRVGDELTAEAAKGFVRKAVAKLVDPKIQVPAVQVRSDVEPYVIVSGPPVGPLPDLRMSFPADLDGDVLVLDAKDEPVLPPVPIVDASIAITLPPGQYTIEHVATGRDKQVFHAGPEPTDEQF